MATAHFEVQKGGGSAYIEDLMYHPHIGESGMATMHVEGAAANGTNIYTTPSALAANSTHKLDAELDGPFGRTVIAHSTDAGHLNIFGFDYLGQPMLQRMNVTANGTNQSIKAFKRVTEIRTESNQTGIISIRQGVAFGLPFCGLEKFHSLSDGRLDTAGGTFNHARNTIQSNVSVDTRGTFVPVTTPNGTRNFTLMYITTNDLPGGLYGPPQYAG